MFPVPKPNNKIRPIINLRGLSEYLTPKKFRLINHFKVPLFLHQAYFHVPVAARHRRFLSIVHQDRVLQFTCLPFRLSTAPLTFARISNWLASCLRRMGIRVIVYLDDFLLANQDPVKLQNDVISATQFLIRLGWLINTDKSVTNPSQSIEFLGIEWDTKRNTKSLPEKKTTSLERDLNEVLKTQLWSWQSAKSLLGKLNFASFIVPLGRLHSREIQRAANLLPDDLRKKKFPIPSKALQQCHWWLQKIREKSSIFKENETIYITTDASDKGWGAQINSKLISGLWESHQFSWHINRKELFAVIQAFSHAKRLIRNKRVIIQSDNRTVVAYVKNQGGTRSKQLTLLVSQLLILAQKLHVELVPQFIPGVYNDVADSLSRQRHLADWHLSDKVCSLIFRKWGVPEIDLFATNKSKVVPVYVSRDLRDKQALFIDAFSRRWVFRLAWIFPPPSLIPRVLAHLNRSEGTFILIVPRWDKVFWRSELCSRAIDRPFQIRNPRHHLRDLTIQKHLPNVRLEAWRIRGDQP
ncbi:uncharacterized protein LOC106141744 [Amyelois transitella]|uniref:uncharacterized protein LOC106141744 n=1 Tax=Amyelois transitella TaxID=680683 RepID=UPI002990650C|nr:uncharacterized protein LOC106141744 [Amyelois transitella]